MNGPGRRQTDPHGALLRGAHSGGLAITTNASCTLFGGVSGSTQATVAAIGGTMRPMLLQTGYPGSFTLGLIINSSDIAFLIPHSIGFIVYGVATSTFDSGFGVPVRYAALFVQGAGGQPPEPQKTVLG